MNRKLLCSFFAFILFLWGSPNLSYPQQGSLPDKAPSFIIEEINAGKSQDILVLLDDTAIESETSLMRRFYGVPYDNQNILEFKTFRYADIKQKVLKSLPEREFELIQDYSHLPVIFLKAKSPNMLSRLLSRNEVARVSEDQAHKHFLLESLPLINQPQVASSMIVGTGTTVAVLDTGVDYSLSSFGNCSLPGVPAGCKVVYASDFAPDDYRLDDNGHGTNVAGIVLGVAPDTRIAALDVFRSDGYAYSSDIISAINWCIANKDSYNIIAMNLSLGAGSYSEPCSGNIFETPVANARAAGILAAIASGNNGYIDSISSPACVPSSVSVGAVYDSNVGPRYWSTCSDETTAADKVTCFSNSASFLTLLAPGSVINAAGISMSGTSQATPHIAGSIAVLKGEGAFPEATPDETVARMTSTGISVTDWRNAIIKPRVDLLAALDSQNLPVANFTGTPTTGSAPLNVNFTDTSTGGPTTWAWNFGDGGTSNLQNPSHTYSTPGTYTVSLTVTNANGSDTETKTGYITAQTPVPPSANFTGNPTTGSAPLNVNFTDTSTGGPTTWAWNFGDGGTSNLQNPSHTYSTPGTYTVSLTVTNANGSDTETKTGYITAQTTCTTFPSISMFYPSSGIAGTSVTIYGTKFKLPALVFFNGVKATVNYLNYSMIRTTVPQGATSGPLWVESPAGCRSNEKYFTVTGSNPAPVANFTGTPTTGSAPLNVNFTDTSTGGPTTWAWNFGDGGTSNLQNPSHTYSTPGTYTVSLTVTNANGSDTETKTSYITVSPIQLPTISVTTPNGGERWTIYKSQAIRWTYSGNPGSTVRIELYKSGVLNRVITSGTSTNAGVYSWFIPYTQAVGSDYRIKITSTSNPSYSDMSNANFSITWGY